MTIIHTDSVDVKCLDQYHGVSGYRRREGYLSLYTFSSDEDGPAFISVDPINRRISEEGEEVCDSFQLTRDQAAALIQSLQEAILTIDENEAFRSDPFREEESGEDYAAYEQAKYGKLTAENGWDPEYPKTSLVYDANGKCLGRLMSIDPDAIAANPNIQPWSKPAR